ncbi:MAG TPA: carbohydrate porin [Burkholderiales bacterium]
MYTGANSLLPSQERSYSFTATAALGFRLWKGSEFYFNPEVAQGVPLSRLTGLGGFTNGEIARTAGQTPILYRARLFLRQTIGLGGGTENVESDMNQLAGIVDRHRVVITAGNVSVVDIFDDNAYSHDARTQFLNWSLVTHGAWDFAADARGYTWGLALEYYLDDWAIRAGRFIQPKQPNQLALDTRIFRHYGDQLEIEHRHALAGQPGKLRFLAFRNRARMSRFQDALAAAALTGDAPDINDVRFTEQVKYGVGFNVEQSVTPDIGVFARASWADGRTETYAYAEIDRSVSAGVSIKGTRWSRPEDTVGLAFASNGLSHPHRDYLAAGGLGFFIGDGRLNYRRENIFEAFYSWRVIKGAWVSADFQRIFNPAYNADRGPVSVGSIRLHAEF